MRDKLRRAAWLTMAIVFVMTGVVFGAVAIWQSANQKEETDKNQPNLACSIQLAATKTVLAEPKGTKVGNIENLRTTDLKIGSGDEVKSGDCITIKYYGFLAESGKKFDSDYKVKQALKYQVGQADVIPGMDQGVIGMKVGGERQIFIPSNLGYGPASQGPIPADSDLVFQVKLISVK